MMNARILDEASLPERVTAMSIVLNTVDPDVREVVAVLYFNAAEPMSFVRGAGVAWIARFVEIGGGAARQRYLEDCAECPDDELVRAKTWTISIYPAGSVQNALLRSSIGQPRHTAQRLREVACLAFVSAPISREQRSEHRFYITKDVLADGSVVWGA